MSHQRKITMSLDTANFIHRDEWRKNSGLPYMSHIYDIMALANKVGIPIDDWQTYCTIILHDTYESAPQSNVLHKIHRELGHEVSLYVSELSFLPDEFQHQREVDVKTQKQNYLDNLAGTEVHPIPKVVKILDRICNTLDFYHGGQVEYARKYYKKASQLIENVFMDEDNSIKNYYGDKVHNGLCWHCYNTGMTIERDK